MSILERLNQRLGFTSNESRIVLFLAGTILVGAGIRLVRNSEPRPAQFNYSSLDSQFASGVMRMDEDSGDSSDQESGAPANRSSSESNLQLQTRSVDINIATIDQLVALPGIGEAMAQRIVAYREKHGRFSSIEEIRHVKGIGQKKYERIRVFLTVGK